MTNRLNRRDREHQLPGGPRATFASILIFTQLLTLAKSTPQRILDTLTRDTYARDRDERKSHLDLLNNLTFKLNHYSLHNSIL